MYKIEIEEDIKKFVSDIQERVDGQFSVFVAGGYCRDKYCGKTPKDVDVFFVPCNGVAQEVGYIPARCYINYNKKTSDMTNTSDMAERGVSQVIGLFNSKLSTTEIQFIVYKKHLTMQEVAEDLDMGINQVVWSPVDSSTYMTTTFLDHHNNQIIECLHNYDKVRTYHRYERMITKFPNYNVVGMPDKGVLPVEEQLQRVAGTYSQSATGSFLGEDPDE